MKSVGHLLSEHRLNELEATTMAGRIKKQQPWWFPLGVHTLTQLETNVASQRPKA
jgi:hypothetical protein